MTLYYESSDGQIIDFMSGGIYAQTPESLLDDEWNYTTITGINGIGKIKRFYKDTKTYSLTLDIMADSAEKFNELMNHMYTVFDRDVQRMLPGKIWWNGYYKQAYIVSKKHSDYDELFESVTKQLTVLSIHPMWTKEYKHSYMASSGEVGALDYGMEGFYDGYDYGGYDYGQAEVIEVLSVDTVAGANFEMTIFGPISQPTIIIGDHKYGMDADIAAGEYAVINTISKTIKKYDQYGREENIYHTRARDSYIFEKLPTGALRILKAKELAFDVIVYDERGEPEWI